MKCIKKGCNREALTDSNYCLQHQLPGERTTVKMHTPDVFNEPPAMPEEIDDNMPDES